MEGRELSVGPPVGPRWVGRPSRRDGTSQEDFPKGQEGLGGPPEGVIRVGRTFQKARRGWEALLEGLGAREVLLEGW